jgi:ribosome maturation factor RimP
VTSPGLERPLKRHAHYEKSIGREVAVKTGVPVAGETSHRGVLEAVGAEEMTVRVGEEARVIPFDEVKGARTVYRWEAKAKPGRK